MPRSSHKRWGWRSSTYTIQHVNYISAKRGRDPLLPLIRPDPHAVTSVAAQGAALRDGGMDRQGGCRLGCVGSWRVMGRALGLQGRKALEMDGVMVVQ